MLRKSARIFLACLIATVPAHSQTPITSAKPPDVNPAAGIWVDLFDGKTLKNWSVDPIAQAASFTVKDGAIHIASTKEGGWLKSDKKYSDFTLTYEMRYVSPDHTGNTGLLLRSPETVLFARGWPGRGFEVESRDMNNVGSTLPPQGAMMGLPPGAPLGRFVYDTEAAKRANRPTGEWNKVEVIAHGNRIWSRFNGEWLSTVYNVATPDGHIGLQAEEGETECRNIRIIEHAADTLTPERYVALFDGKQLNGFSISDAKFAKNVSVQDGVLRLQGTGGYLKTSSTYTNYTLRLEFRTVTTDAIDSIFLHVRDAAVDASGWPTETTVAQLRHQALPVSTEVATDRRWMGAIMRRGSNEGPVMIDTAAVVAAYRGLGEWQEATITVEGRNVTFALNGVVIGEAGNVSGSEGGAIGLQIGAGTTEFRKIEIKGYYSQE